MAPRLLVVMGSGETTPTMVKVHRQVFDRLGDLAGPAVLLGTPYGFQTNAEDISARAVNYFRQSVGQRVEVVALPRTEGAPAQEVEQALGDVAAARWVFSGPGSPTYALRQWRPTVLPRLLSEKLAYGGCITFSSAAAMTLGRWTVPVYEVYKSGGDVIWAQGLDVLGAFGLAVALIAHFDNAEGGNHDTRYCYLGERRLRALEGQLPDEGWVLGVDEHTAAVLDFEAGTLEVMGLGAVSVRADGKTARLEAGETVTVDALASTARSLRAGQADTGGAPGAGEGQPARALGASVAPAVVAGGRFVAGTRFVGGAIVADGTWPAAERTGTPDATGGPVPDGSGGPHPALVPGSAGRGQERDPLLAEVRRLSASFDHALGGRDAAAAMEAVFDLEDALRAWSADTFESDHVDRARAELRRMLARLGQLASVGLREPRSLAEPWVEALLVERAAARSSRRYADSDRIRGTLARLGVEVQDTADGSRWELRPPEA